MMDGWMNTRTTWSVLLEESLSKPQTFKKLFRFVVHDSLKTLLVLRTNRRATVDHIALVVLVSAD